MAGDADARTRRRLDDDLEATLFVEAGAGTGKTTAIVGRIVNLIARGRLRTDGLVAITFTEAAAAELRARVRERLEAAARERPGEEERARCREAAATLDLAAIDTIHAFAGDLLRTFPLEAGLPPGFQTLDAIESELRFRERFAAWFEAAAADPQLRTVVGRCLHLGLAVDRIRNLAAALAGNSDILDRDSRWEVPPPPPALEAAHGFGFDIAEAQSLLALAPDDSHPLVAQVRNLAFFGERLRAAGDEASALTALQPLEWLAKGKGRKEGWGLTPDGRNGCDAVRELLGGIIDDARALLAAHRQAAFAGLLAALVALTLDHEDERRQAGVATFHDLLTWARNLLRDDAGVRARARARWSRIFVDEFQDTDPLQAELAFYLSGAVDDPPPADWRDTRLVEGKLCLVGDPKQSIYRFRRADIALYQQLLQRVGHAEPLTRNFRSVPPLVSFVNHHFARLMTLQPGVQAAYEPLIADVAGDGPAVWRVGGVVDGNQQLVWRREAEAVAEVAARAVNERWPVRDPQTGERRPAGWSDVCVLLPTRTNLRALEREFERWNVPFRVESGELVMATQEVRDLISCLRAIDDPSDQVALVAGLRSALFGVSDVELLQWVESGGRLNHQAPGEGTGERVAEALGRLAALHRLRHELSVPALVGRLVDERRLVAAAFGQPRPREVWRRHRYVAARARAFAATGRVTLREFVEWMEGLEREGARDAAGSIVETDEQAVRVLTIHRAKGLEFPIVLMTGLGSETRFQAPPVIVDRTTGRLDAQAAPRGWCTAGYEVARAGEEALFRAEQLRLAYVAATRARDHLVVSLFRTERAERALVSGFVESLASRPGVTEIEVGSAPPPATPPVTPDDGESVDGFEARERAWIDARARVLRERQGARLASATSLSHLVEPPLPDDEGGEEASPPDAADEGAVTAAFRPGRGGTALGRAVHAVLQVIDLATLEGLGPLAHARAASEGIPQLAGRVAELVRLACSTPAVTRAVAARHWREVPAASEVEGVVLEGFIDLLYEDGDGVGIVDYKTDDISPGEVDRRLERYRIQGGAYALLVEATTGRRVTAVDFVFAAVGVVRPVADLAAAQAEVRRRLQGVEPAALEGELAAL